MSLFSIPQPVSVIGRWLLVWPLAVYALMCRNLSAMLNVCLGAAPFWTKLACKQSSKNDNCFEHLHTVFLFESYECNTLFAFRNVTCQCGYALVSFIWMLRKLGFPILTPTWNHWIGAWSITLRGRWCVYSHEEARGLVMSYLPHTHTHG